ncbi:DUF402 domain-containing protein [Planococcus shixiaomingii]|uniref:DUF402 domain-containing protein n=1 Tax=Planococcus shixiaomingii TaxID=3058393 RepID=UPI002627D530|nr:DUF402 domain-containing protein [Planococcus sp. N022]WKA56643.1 DUF402 domain-containing protein [Planococcus sp. N022]
MEIKRKAGDRAGWKRVVERHYQQRYIETKDYCGYVTLLHVKEVTKPLWTTYNSKQLCILNNGYVWLQHFPEGHHHSVTTTFNENGDIVQWYIDICLKNGVDNNIPYMDDLFLDIVLLPTGQVIEKDKDELEEALSLGVISRDYYNLAWREFYKILEQINTNTFIYSHLSLVHKEELIKAT